MTTEISLYRVCQKKRTKFKAPNRSIRESQCHVFYQNVDKLM